MAYLPKNQYEIKYTNGGEFRFKDTGREYKGKYIATVKNRYYAGGSIQSIQGELIPIGRSNTNTIIKDNVDNFIYASIRQNETKKQSKYEHVPSYKPQPTDKDYEKGFFTRYIAIRRNNGKIFEVNKNTYKDILSGKTHDPNLYRAFTLIWNLGEDAKEINSQNLNHYEDKVPGITRFFFNTAEFSRT